MPHSCLWDLQKTFRRQSTGFWEWDDARRIARRLEEAGAWDGTIPELPQPQVASKSERRTTIEAACKLFLDELAETAAFATHKKYCTRRSKNRSRDAA
jgi:hypothetical protein